MPKTVRDKMESKYLGKHVVNLGYTGRGKAVVVGIHLIPERDFKPVLVQYEKNKVYAWVSPHQIKVVL